MRRISVRVWTVAFLLLLRSPPAAADPLAADELRLQRAGIGVDGASVLAYFRQQAVDANPQPVEDLVRQLGDVSFRARERASEALVALGARSLPHLRKAAEGTDAEVRRRARECLRRIEADFHPALVAAAARVLAA